MSLGLSPLGTRPLGLAASTPAAAPPGDTVNTVGAAGISGNVGGVGAISQTQNVTGTGGVQANQGGTGSIGQAQNLAGAAGEQANTAGTGIIGQTQNLIGSGGTSANEGSTGTIGQTQNLTGAAGTSTNEAGTGAISIAPPDALVGAPGVQGNEGGTGAISQAQNLAGAAGTQANEAGTGAVSIAVDPRYARPDITIAPGGWQASTGGDLADAISEPSADATTYITTDTPGARCSTKANPVALPPPGATPVYRYQLWSNTGDGVRAILKQGAVEIASWTHATLPAVPTVFAQSLTPQQTAAITDGLDLRFDFEAL